MPENDHRLIFSHNVGFLANTKNVAEPGSARIEPQSFGVLNPLSMISLTRKLLEFGVFWHNT